jgi:dipeptidyl aminopeptidase/acylaminoacyl peptidase
MNFYVQPTRRLLVFALIIFLFFSCSKNNTNRNGAVNDVTVFSNIQYGSNKDISGNTIPLLLDVYIPMHIDQGKKLPLMLFVHGGGFVAGDKSDAASFMKTFALAGFAAVSINYRLDSSVEGSSNPCETDTNLTSRGLYMAVQDVKAALRFMVANASEYNIDISKIFLSGNSAGAITVLNTQFVTQAEFNEIIPGIETELGGIDNSGNTLNNTYQITGIAANSGCLSKPAYITNSNAVPVIFFHGGQDDVIPINQGHTYNCPNTLYVYGSSSLYVRMQEIGAPSVIHILPTGSHGPYNESFLQENETCFFNSIINDQPESGAYSGYASSCP